MSVEFNGNLKDAIITMLSNQVTSCEVTQTINGVAVTADITIKKIVDDGVVLYDTTEEVKEII